MCSQTLGAGEPSASDISDIVTSSVISTGCPSRLFGDNIFYGSRRSKNGKRQGVMPGLAWSLDEAKPLTND